MCEDKNDVAANLFDGQQKVHISLCGVCSGQWSKTSVNDDGKRMYNESRKRKKKWLHLLAKETTRQRMKESVIEHICTSQE